MIRAPQDLEALTEAEVIVARRTTFISIFVSFIGALICFVSTLIALEFAIKEINYGVSTACYILSIISFNAR